MFISVTPRGHAEEFLKFAGEVTVVIEADVLSDAAEGGIAVTEYLAGACEPVAYQKARRCLLKDCAEAALKLAYGEARDFGEVGDLDRFGIVLADVVDSGIHAAVGLPRIVTAVEVAHATDDSDTCAIAIVKREFTGDMPRDGAIWIGDQFDSA